MWKQGLLFAAILASFYVGVCGASASGEQPWCVQLL